MAWAILKPTTSTSGVESMMCMLSWAVSQIINKLPQRPWCWDTGSTCESRNGCHCLKYILHSTSQTVVVNSNMFR